MVRVSGCQLEGTPTVVDPVAPTPVNGGDGDGWRIGRTPEENFPTCGWYLYEWRKIIRRW